MRFYTAQHRYYCGIDLHARRMYICILEGGRSHDGLNTRSSIVSITGDGAPSLLAASSSTL